MKNKWFLGKKKSTLNIYIYFIYEPIFIFFIANELSQPLSNKYALLSWYFSYFVREVYQSCQMVHVKYFVGNYDFWNEKYSNICVPIANKKKMKF